MSRWDGGSPICRHILQTERCKLRHQLIWSQTFPPNIKTAGADASHEFLYHLETFAGGTSGLKVPNDMTWPRLMKNQEVVIGLGGGLIFYIFFKTMFNPIYLGWNGFQFDLRIFLPNGWVQKPPSNEKVPIAQAMVGQLHASEYVNRVSWFPEDGPLLSGLRVVKILFKGIAVHLLGLSAGVCVCV